MRRVLKLPAAVLAAALTIAAVATPGRAQAPGGAVYAVTYLDVGTPAIAAGVALLATFREASRHEAANLEFTVLQQIDRPNRFVIVEGWKDQAAFEAHDKGAPKAAFQDALAPIRNSPPDRHVLQAFAPAAPRPAPPADALYMVEHVDFLPAFGPTAPPLVKSLAASTQNEPGALRYEIFQQPAPRTNHYEVVSAWTDAKAFDDHETAAHTRQFRAATPYPGRANLYDQRRYRAL